MTRREHSSALVFSLAAFVFALLAGVIIPLSGGARRGPAQLDWTPPATATTQVKAVRLTATSAPTATPAPTAAPVASPTRPQPTTEPAPAAPTQAPTEPPAVARIPEGPINLRAGPGKTYPVLATTKGGEEYTITGRSEDALWVQLCCVAAARVWVAAEFAELPAPIDAYRVVR